MQPDGQSQSYPGVPSFAGGPAPMGPGFPPGYPAGPAPASAFPLGRLGGAIAAASGVIVLFGTLLNLYTISVDPSGADPSGREDIPSGTVDVGVGFYNILPLPAPVTALVIPMLMLVAALTALPAILGRSSAGAALVSAVSAVAATLLSLVLMFSNPLPSVELSGHLASEFSDNTDFKSIDDAVSSVVDISPGAGLIIALIVGLIGSAGAVLSYLYSSDSSTGIAAGAAHTPAPFGAPAPFGGPAPFGAPQPGMHFTGQMPTVVAQTGSEQTTIVGQNTGETTQLQPGQGDGKQPGSW